MTILRSQEWWHATVMPATEEDKNRRIISSRPIQGPYLRNKI
jgi:hypothetical protein